MNIRITSLKLTNFKCFREKQLSLDSDVVTIMGRNGAGKTTIADAILFCLFGKNSEGQSDLELFKTRADGKVIPNLDHSVEITLFVTVPEASASGKEVSLRRSIKEVWVKKRGSDESVFKNNTVEYFVNGESFTKADYEKYISTLVDERVFRAITNPNYFASLKWQDQRNFLTSMVGDIVPEEIADTDELVSLVHALDNSNDDIVSYLKHLKYQIKQIKDKLDKIPVRLEEQNKALPEKLDWDALSAELDKARSELKEVEEKIVAINQGNGADIKRAELHKILEKKQKVFNAFNERAYQEYNAEYLDKQKKVNDATIKFNEELNNQKLMQQTIEADNRLIERCKQSIKECDEELERLRLAWPTRKFEVKEGDNICPACGQYLSPDVFANKVAAMRTRFNEALEAEKQSLRDKAKKVNQNKEDATKELETTEQKLVNDTATLEVIKETINTIFAEKAKLEKMIIVSPENRLAANKEAVGLYEQIEGLKKQLDSVTDSDTDKGQLADLQEQRSRQAELLAQLQQQLATRQQYDRIQALISGIHSEQKDLVSQLSELEKQEDIARQYQFRQNQLLESRINKHFSIVQWRLFRTVNNGGDSFEEPFCECYVDGIPYHSGLNQAARLNAGLDICRALCRFYNVTAPIVVDNCESVNNLLETESQQIQLYVSNDEQLIVQ